METIDAWLDRSIACYREILNIYQSIQNAVAAGEPAATLYALFEQMRETARQARDSDSRIWSGAGQAGGCRPEDRPRFSEWQSLLAQVWEANQVIQRRLQAAQAVVRDDYFRISDGKQGISGYRSGRDPAGRRINIVSA